jgi:hypothetical protein
MKRKLITVMVNNTININKANNYLSTQTIASSILEILICVGIELSPLICVRIELSPWKLELFRWIF